MESIYTPPGAGDYFDDFDSSKNYLQILFNPTRAVQARELTQMQSIFQEQQARAGSFWYKSGTPISGGRITVTYDQPFMKIGSTDMTGQPIDPNLLVGRTYIGQTSNQRIIVTDCDVDNRYLFFSYLGGLLTEGELFISTTTPTRSFYMTAGTVDKAVVAHCTAGTLFIDGFYTTITESNIVVTSSDQNALYNIGFSVNSNYVTSQTDSTLNDNAAGSTNANAPGADRYQMDVQLYSFQGDTPPDGIRFVSGIAIENQKIIKEQANPLSDNSLLDLLAKRTYDESGSYTVTPWKAQLYDIEGNTEQYQVSIQEGSGYIRGYEVTTTVSTPITADKPRDTIIKENSTLFDDTGLYCLALQENNKLSANNLPEPGSDVYVKTGTNGTGNTLGTCKIQTYVREGSYFRIYLINASSIINSFNGAKSLCLTNSADSYINVYINEDGFAELYGSEAPFIYKSTESNVKTLTDNTIQYQMVKQYTGTSNASGNTLNIIETDSSVNLPTTDGLVAVLANGAPVDLSTLIMTPNNTNTTSSAVISGTGISNSTPYTVYVRVSTENMTSRVKQLVSVTETFSVTKSETSKTLKNADILEIVSVTQTNNISNTNAPDDFKDYITLNNGQTDYYYETGSISGFNSAALNAFKANNEMTTTYEVTYTYYIHAGAGPFTVDSYNTQQNQSVLGGELAYEKIPTYTASNGTTYNLRDCFDYRVKKTDTFDYVPIPRTEIICDIEKYLPRIDALYVASNGTFGILQGIAAENPDKPIGTEYMMILYYLKNGAYTQSVSDVTLEYVDNRRYTMKDIGKLNTRLTNLEETVSLNQLEQSAVNMQITDTSGLNRYKTGIFTDNFSSFDNSDCTNAEWNCNIDAEEQSLRSNFNAENLPFKLNETSSSNIKVFDKVVSLPYITEVYAKNTYVTDTINVQNLLFYTWKGNITLTPSLDTWVNDLGQFIVSTTWSNSAQPKTTYKTWSTTATYENHQHGVNWGFGDYIGKQVTTTYSQATSYVGSWTISDYKIQKESQDEFMRQRTVEYAVTGLRPGVPVTATLDDKEVALTANIPDSDGNLNGSFVVPEKIPVGTKIFAMTDADGTSSAEAEYTAKGKTIWTEVDRTYIRKWTAVTHNATVTSQTATAWDPVAESIYIEEEDGIYVDSVDIYFAQKDSTNIEVWCYIVESENGYPTSRVLPFSLVSLPPSKVNISDTGTVATNFKFQAPVYLEGQKEYAIIVATTSYEYNIFISTLGRPDLNTGIGVHEQPYLGNLFMSQNTRTWVAETQSDLSFKLYKCNFTSNSGTAMFDLDPSYLENDFEVAMTTFAANVFSPENTSYSSAYRWSTESKYTSFNVQSNVDYTSMKVIRPDAGSPLTVRIQLATNSKSLSPLIDLEDIYGIFTNNTVTENTDSDASTYPYVSGTYISKATTLKYASDNVRLLLDAITPNDSKVEAYIKTNTYNPTYVKLSTKGSIGVTPSTVEALKGESVRCYYFNNTTQELEPQSDVEITGFTESTSKIYLRSISNPDMFKNAVAGSTNEEQYSGLNSKYTHILLIPVFSDTNISVTTWNSSITYTTGTYVFYNGYMWQSLRNVEAGQIPSEMSISWKIIDVIKVVSVLQSDEPVEWRPLVIDSSNDTNTSAEKQTSFIEYTYYPEIAIESEFQTFSIKLVMKSKDKLNIPRVRNLRVIATL